MGWNLNHWKSHMHWFHISRHCDDVLNTRIYPKSCIHTRVLISRLRNGCYHGHKLTFRVFITRPINCCWTSAWHHNSIHILCVPLLGSFTPDERLGLTCRPPVGLILIEMFVWGGGEVSLLTIIWPRLELSLEFLPKFSTRRYS